MAANISRIRKSRQISLKQLESHLAKLGRRISLSGLSKIENGDRKVDVDDLFAIALTLDVSPIALLLPQGAPDDAVDVSGGRASLALFWQWALAADVGVSSDDLRSFQARSLPGWLSVESEIEWSGDGRITLGVAGPGTTDLVPRTTITFHTTVHDIDEPLGRRPDGIDQAAP